MSFRRGALLVALTTAVFGSAGTAHAESVIAPSPIAHGVAVDSSGRVVAAGRANNTFALVRYGQDGRLDPSFGADGLVTTHFGLGGWDSGRAVAIEPSGKIVVAGDSCCSASTRDFLLVRYRPNGKLDPTFGGDGKVATHLGTNDYANAVAIDRSGRIVVAGDDNHDFVLLRYKANGRLDRNFGSHGVVTTRFSLGKSSAKGVAIDPSGRIVAAGVAFSSTDSAAEIALARYLPSGKLDPHFGAGGPVTSDFDPEVPGKSSGASGVALDPSGRIAVAGNTFGVTKAISDGDFALARFNGDGTRDATFGSGGEVTTDFNPGVTHYASDDEALSVAIDPAGDIVAAGTADNCPAEPCARGLGSNFHDHIAVARYRPDGSLDGTFGNGGKVTVPGDGYATALALEPAGDVATAGLSGGKFAVARFTGGGSLDPVFGAGGVVTTDFPPKTWVTSANINPRKHRATFTFDASGVFSELQCRLLSSQRPNPSFKGCVPRTKTYTGLKRGRYTFEVRALRAAGPDHPPARWPFRIG